MSEPTSESASAQTVDARLFEAARNGDVGTLTRLLDQHPGKLHARSAPYEWSLLHAAAHTGRLAAVELLLARGLDVNTREKGDNTYPMHWAAAAGHLEVVKRLAEAGGDVVGHGDDHDLEVIGWATCWDGCDDAVHRAVAEFLLDRGARHHIFSAIAMGLADEVRRIAAADPAELERRMSHNEDFQRPLHFAVRMNRAPMVPLLLELGADPLGKDDSGYAASAYAMGPGIDRPVMEAIRAQGRMDLLAALALAEWDSAPRLLSENPDGSPGVLHLMAKRGDAPAVQWLLDHGVDPNAGWNHWDAEVTPLHLAVMGNHPAVVLLLLKAGANPRLRDSKHDSDAIGWAEFFQRHELVRVLRAAAGHPSR
jgi:ankyrin repeat protein